MKRRSFIAILAINILIPLFFGAFVREQFVGLFNPYLEMSLGERFLFSLRPVNLIAIIVFGLGAHVVVVTLLRPLHRYLKGSSSDYDKARKAAIRVPWYLMGLHIVLWIIGVTAVYGLLYSWNSPGGIGYFKSLLNSVATGLITGLSGALAISVILAQYKPELRMTYMRSGERDLFLAVKDYLILAAVVINMGVFFEHIALFYRTGNIPEGMQNHAVWILVVTLFYVLVLMGLLALSRRESYNQYSYLEVRLKRLAEAGGDLTKPIYLVNFDELGRVSERINSFVSSLRSLVAGVIQEVESVKETGERLMNSVSEVEQQAAGNASTVEQASARIQSTRTGIDSSKSSVQAIDRAIGSLDKQIEDQSSAVEESSASVEQMVNSVRSIGKTVRELESIFGELDTAVQSSRDQMVSYNNRMQEVAQNAQTLQQANQLISQVAGQTNLLAMNAAIEAAHAGDAGRGFAVVAEEIRNLAENATRQSKQIKQSLNETTGLIGSIAGDMQETVGTAEHMSELLGKTRDMQGQVLNGLSEQESGSREVLKALETMRESTTAVREAGSAMTYDAQSVKQEISALSGISDELEEAMTNVRESSGRTTASVSEMRDSTEETRSALQNIARMVGGFRV